jgi:hypothetical protein
MDHYVHLSHSAADTVYITSTIKLKPTLIHQENTVSALLDTNSIIDDLLNVT